MKRRSLIFAVGLVLGCALMIVAAGMAQTTTQKVLEALDFSELTTDELVEVRDRAEAELALRGEGADKKKTAATTSEVMVWVPQNGGTKYHSKSTCSGMKNPKKVTLEDAKDCGFEPCGKCKPAK